MRDGWYRVKRSGSDWIGSVEYHFVSVNRDLNRASRVKDLEAIGYQYTPVLILEEDDIPVDAVYAIETALYDYRYPGQKDDPEDLTHVFVRRLKEFLEIEDETKTSSEE